MWSGSCKDWNDGYSLGEVSLSALMRTPASESCKWESLGLSFNWGLILNSWTGSNSCLVITSSSAGFMSGKYEGSNLPGGLTTKGGAILMPDGPAGPGGT